MGGKEKLDAVRIMFPPRQFPYEIFRPLIWLTVNWEIGGILPLVWPSNSFTSYSSSSSLFRTNQSLVFFSSWTYSPVFVPYKYWIFPGNHSLDAFILSKTHPTLYKYQPTFRALSYVIISSTICVLCFSNSDFNASISAINLSYRGIPVVYGV